jgi:hypothetical protein
MRVWKSRRWVKSMVYHWEKARMQEKLSRTALPVRVIPMV